MIRLAFIALLAILLAGCATRQEPPRDGKIFDDNLRGTGPGWDQTRITTGPPMPPDLSPEVKKAIAVENKNQFNRYRPKTPHVTMQPGDTNRFVGPTQPTKQ